MPRGELQRVRYELEGTELWRESWSVLDRLTEEDGQRRVLLLEGVESVSLRFLNRGGVNASQSPLGGEWDEAWDHPSQLPAAVEVEFELEGFGEVRRVFSIPTP